MGELIGPDEIYVPFQATVDYDLVALHDVVSGKGKYLRATPKREAADELYEVTRKAKQLASIAADWNLTEVEIDGEMVSIYELLAYFSTVLNEVDNG